MNGLMGGGGEGRQRQERPLRWSPAQATVGASTAVASTLMSLSLSQPPLASPLFQDPDALPSSAM